MRTFVLTFFLLSFVSRAEAAVLINEIAWMGSADSSTNEWIELSNTGSTSNDLSGWILRIEGKKDIALSGTISGGGYYLVERTDDETVPGVAADLVASFGTGLSNDGAMLTLLNASGGEVDRVNGTDAWQIGGGDVMGNNTTKETAQRSGSSWLTAQATPRAANTASAQPQTQTTEQASTQTSQSLNTSQVSLNNFPVDPQIFASAGSHARTTVVGAPVVFTGKVLGLKKEPIENARMVWSFGDGATAEGNGVSHVYYYPGEYTAVLDAASGYYSASDRTSVSVSAPNLLVESGGDSSRSFVAISNKGGDELDLSLWNIVAGTNVFTIPKNTFLLPGKKLVFASEITHLVTPAGEIVLLKFPNGMNVPLGGTEPARQISVNSVPTQITYHEPREEIHASNQTAAVLNSASESSRGEEAVPQKQNPKESDPWKWYTGAALLGVLGIFALRLGKKADSEEGISADDFEIIEEDSK